MQSSASLEDTASSKDKARADRLSRIPSACPAKKALLLSVCSIVSSALFVEFFFDPVAPLFFGEVVAFWVYIAYMLVALLVSLSASFGAVTISVISARDWFNPRFRHSFALVGMAAGMVALTLSGAATYHVGEQAYKLWTKAPS